MQYFWHELKRDQLPDPILISMYEIIRVPLWLLTGNRLLKVRLILATKIWISFDSRAFRACMSFFASFEFCGRYFGQMVTTAFVHEHKLSWQWRVHLVMIFIGLKLRMVGVKAVLFLVQPWLGTLPCRFHQRPSCHQEEKEEWTPATQNIVPSFFILLCVSSAVGLDPKFLGPGIRIRHYLYGSFHHQAKKVRKTLICTVLWLLYDFLLLKTNVNIASKSKKYRKT